jgi:poly(3-hydroxybutyrate) depolymerase
MLHGCVQSYKKANSLFAQRSGFNEYAATNDLIVVYPQINDAEHAHCWDMLGWTGENFTTKEGVQSKAIYAMIKDLKKSK